MKNENKLIEKIEKNGLEYSDTVKCTNCGNDIEYFHLLEKVCGIYKNQGREALIKYIEESPEIECETCHFYYSFTIKELNPILKSLNDLEGE